MWRRWWSGANGEEPSPRSRAPKKPRPVVWCPTCPPRGQWVKAYREGGPPIPHTPCRCLDDNVETRQIKPIPRVADDPE